MVRSYWWTPALALARPVGSSVILLSLSQRNRRASSSKPNFSNLRSSSSSGSPRSFSALIDFPKHFTSIYLFSLSLQQSLSASGKIGFGQFFAQNLQINQLYQAHFQGLPSINLPEILEKRLPFCRERAPALRARYCEGAESSDVGISSGETGWFQRQWECKVNLSVTSPSFQGLILYVQWTDSLGKNYFYPDCITFRYRQ
ncbi:hypothetical protein FGO68_gene10228 [Halteria grandinella]|uniref:Uncharacterized protein n=1 Tax=Halteria grandinella TaxID=5974 RepID=A0A8J8NPR4_HALGN|nr:hypothetical protein FGO68_gene10228 [Halteria grandinella]